MAILVSNTLGTVLGDFLADSYGLGFVGANMLITGALGLVLLATFLPGFRASRCFGLPLS